MLDEMNWFEAFRRERTAPKRSGLCTYIFPTSIPPFEPPDTENRERERERERERRIKMRRWKEWEESEEMAVEHCKILKEKIIFYRYMRSVYSPRMPKWGGDVTPLLMRSSATAIKSS